MLVRDDFAKYHPYDDTYGIPGHPGYHPNIEVSGNTKESFKKKHGILAKFKCMACEYQFETRPGPLNCFKCGHIFVEWLNWEEVSREIHGKKDNR